jgi:murein tripeptide amidase MpaA
MKKFVSCRLFITALILFIPMALFILPANLHWFVSAQAIRTGQQSGNEKLSRQFRHEQLKSRLTANNGEAVRESLNVLKSLDEPGTLALWKTALENTNSALKQEVWNAYQKVRLELERKEMVPQIVRIQATSTEILKIAEQLKLETHIWSSSDKETIAAAPFYLLAELRNTGMNIEVLYDSISEFQEAQKQGEQTALSIAAARKMDNPEKPLQARIAVVDLTKKGQPVAGYSDWLGDQENILMQNESFIAYLDVFSSDGLTVSINSRIEEQYERRGYRLKGFYTMEEFSQVVTKFFPDKSFTPPTASQGNSKGKIQTQGAEGRFHSYDEMVSEFNALAQAHPNLARVFTLGKTYENRQIVGLKISKDAPVNDSTKNDVLITGGYHAREWISIEVPIYFANQLLSKYATDDSIRYLVDHMQFWIVPIVNPDGVVYSQGATNDQLDNVRLWRKNRRPVAVSECSSGMGVDLNRNFDFQWRLRSDEPCPQTSDDIGASDNPDNEIYRGPAPESELEVRAINSLTKDPARHFKGQLDYHSFSQLVLYPWGYQLFSAPDAGTLSKLARRMSDEILKVDGKSYRPQQAHTLYTTTGTSSDYAYSVNNIAAPFVIEMRPTCCNFNLPESEIQVTNEENWAGARPVFQWVSEPPILQSVSAYQQIADGTFSKLVYAARWVDTENGREMIVDTRYPGLQFGQLQLRLQFSKPMDATETPLVTLGRNEASNELVAEQVGGTEGWQKTIYQGDTWIGEVTIPQDADEVFPWKLAVSADDATPFKLDARPETIASYAVGTNGWRNYENEVGASAEGGIDTHHRLSPTLRSDFLSLQIASPSGGERLVAGEPFSVAWLIPKESGFVPVQNDIMISTNSGLTFNSLSPFVPGNVEKFQVTLPSIATTQARIRVSSREGTFGNSIYGDSQADFTIGVNVGAKSEMTFVSSEKVDQNWTDTAFDNPAETQSGGVRLIVNMTLINKGTVAIANPFFRVAELNRGILLSRDRKSKQAVGALQTIDVGTDNLLSPNETVQVRLILGVVSPKKIFFSINLYGVASGGSVGSGGSVEIFRGKPKSR